ncbi:MULTISPECIES: bifunctional acetaldehyde-CoA/alcohol dehydrogenase [Romboutsia]|uniref:bifunctional acetaldehyde-CoA/alcohol dehydrogenase n=1 Tax=Romboutsia TaxID=1501226 RepID=UPI000AE7A988|nr:MULTISPECIES: bifunctional acetaldehyde-CoA/alcohol dehydrogenase [Romboutsia]MDB8805435.1 bifunctional acetaldehyde-CoA/alcohol dehydrogenase [Romboutsia sp. 1001216sp1]MDB8807343.1 bifunctional acetaldehyde-CoA/alcohol dehydrogenase [Romboutsia sp. 1001216sp1]MDB8811308.1 bifunctional acetaldehyde-CoA/alcohol dehydrogenase [Romboutsia sp. 1001216sp1]MDB8817145.1 bifunctional acetaldehyde-CoA/alcohol dehydrogenase [Romboutsia sp. 1001216sp1]MDB8819347.1 bifunctional acetaldehyde-CoA/alcoho
MTKDLKKVKNVKEKQELTVESMINDLVTKGNKAKEEMLKLDQEAVDKIVKAMAKAGLDKHIELAQMAVEETERGIFEDKVTKNIFATEYVYNSIKYTKTVGVVEENDEENYMMVAEPIGVIAGVTPVTNPTSTTMFKSLIAIKGRNPIIFSFHPSAQKCSAEAARILRDAAIEAGAPENCIQWIEEPSLEASSALMKNNKVALILATGGPGMVKAAYSSGKPALGVGAGNVPCFIEKSADIKQAVNDLILSKTFDNGMICASEQAVIIEEPIYNEVVDIMKGYNCYFVNKKERELLEKTVINPETKTLNPNIVGQSPYKIAQMAGFEVPKDAKMLVAEIEGVGMDYPLSKEKLSPVLACLKVKNAEEGIQRCVEMTEFGGLGHSAVIHSENDDIILKFSEKVRTGRLLVNAPSTFGAIGDVYNVNTPSLTLGCGSMGNNSTTDNVSAVNLINLKKVTKRRVNMQWFKVPERIYHEVGSIQYLEKLPQVERVMIVTDRMMVQLGYVEKLQYHLRKRRNPVMIEVFADVEPDPSVDTVLNGADAMRKFKPDTIIALGGGSAMDAAKGMWLFYENPEADFEDLRLKFMDIRKRIYKFPKLGRQAKMVAIPTTSGTGSEVTSFAVITDKVNNIKYPLADYELTPDVAIIDPTFVMSVPAAVTADTGLDVLTHAIEAYVSVMATDYTDALAMKAIQMVFEYLPKSYKGANTQEGKEAREKMHNASCMAGMAFANAFLGINHSLAHKLGSEFHIPHGRANAILLPYVIEYNASMPTKFAAFPRYKSFVADKKYAEIAKMLGLKANTTEEGVKSLVEAIRNLMRELNMPMTIRECGIEEKIYMGAIEKLALDAFDDQCTPANPRQPLVSELVEIYKTIYGDKKTK